MNRGIDHGIVFVDDESRIDFGRRLAEIHELFGVSVLAYCLMDNHYHLVLHCPTGGLSDAMQRLSAVFTRHLNDRLDRDGPVFRGRFTSRLITTPDYEANAIRYVHRNALDVAGVRAVDDYRWSSHRAYLGHRQPVAWLDTDRALGWFPDRDAFHRFVADDRIGAALHSSADPAAVLENVEFLLRGVGTGASRVCAGDVRAVAFAVTDHLEEPQRRGLIDLLECTTDASLRNAKSRAHQRLDARPDLRRIATHALALAVSSGVRPQMRRAGVSTGV